jgi:hypothetical protein
MISRSNRAWALAAFTSLLLAVAPVYAADLGYATGESENENIFVRMCDASADGMVSKAQVMKQVEKMFDKADTDKKGKINKRQVEFFLKELTRMSGA